MTTKDDTTVTIAGATYRLTEPLRFSTALDVAALIREGDAGTTRAGAVALMERCPALRSRLGLGPCGSDVRAYGSQVLDALVDPAHRGGKARQSTARASRAEVFEACGAALLGLADILTGASEPEVEAAAGNSDATP